MNGLLYVVHYNWEWIVDECINNISKSLRINEYKKVNKISSLYSQFDQVKKGKHNYALFRLEFIDYDNIITSIWSDCDIFGSLDAKDSLYKYLLSIQKVEFMPNTYLLPWNISTLDELNDITKNEVNFPCLLKAALGSGGFGIYFVNNYNDIIEVIKAHAKRALSFDGFIDSLRSKYDGKIPCWSLQQLLVPVYTKINSINRKTQVRAYVLYCNNNKSVYYYNKFEVRLPYWDKELVSTSTNSNYIDEVETELIGNGNAIPYNYKRSKTDTERYLLEEIEELSGSHSSIVYTLVNAFKDILSTNIKSVDSNDSKISIGIAAIDLIITKVNDQFKSYIIELNNNPAMPSNNKNMSSEYKEHLSTFVTELLTFNSNVNNSKSNSLFIKI